MYQPIVVVVALVAVVVVLVLAPSSSPMLPPVRQLSGRASPDRYRSGFNHSLPQLFAYGLQYTRTFCSAAYITCIFQRFDDWRYTCFPRGEHFYCVWVFSPGEEALPYALKAVVRYQDPQTTPNRSHEASTWNVVQRPLTKGVPSAPAAVRIRVKCTQIDDWSQKLPSPGRR